MHLNLEARLFILTENIVCQRPCCLLNFRKLKYNFCVLFLGDDAQFEMDI